MRIKLGQDEKTLLLLREHKVLLLGKLLIWGVAAAIPFLLQEVAAVLYADVTLYPEYSIWAVLRSLYYLFCLLSLFLIVTLYYLNVHIVTSERLIDSDQRSIFHHHTTEMHLHKVQDASFEIKGVLGQLFNYGNVIVQSAGDISKVVFENVPHPEGVKNAILQRHYIIMRDHDESEEINV